MTLPAPTYDLVLLLDPQADDATRAKLVTETRASISAQGELLRHDEWGERALTYPIERRASARYHLMQFHVADTELLSSLDRTLRLADEVLRFRIIKLAPGVPSAPDMSAAPAATPRGESAEGEPAPPAAEGEPAETAVAAETPTPAEAPVAAEPTEAAPQTPADAEPAAEVAVGEPS
ncbi:MAG TPA: 30S ribosomal protein S6 [Solirubrobacteraceae bacterium]|nr:30S ribosomal protein S6 [Solirubrobacteraceae bacterium]